MNVFCLLISSPAQGLLWMLFIFVFCFLGVHVLKLALIGASNLQTKPPSTPEKTEEKKPLTENPKEPVYYIVERKTRRAKSSYSEPKEIRFK